MATDFDDDSPLIRYLDARSEYFDSLSKSQLKAQDELLLFLQKSADNLQSKEDQISAEANQFERQYTSFFALAISFIVSGMLQAVPTSNSTVNARILYFAALMSAVIAAIFLFLEYRNTSKFFDSALKHVKNGEVILNNRDLNPAEIEEQLNSHLAKMPTKSTLWTQRVETLLVIVSFTLLGLWLYETLFNPNFWIIF